MHATAIESYSKACEDTLYLARSTEPDLGMSEVANGPAKWLI